jgi:hypothetical protein
MTHDAGSRSTSPSRAPQDETASQVAKKCLEIIEIYRKGPHTPLTKASVIHDITTTLTATATQFTESDINDALGSYLGIINQCDATEIIAGGDNGETERSRTLDEPQGAHKRVLSPEPVIGASKRHRLDESEFPWAVRESLSEPGLCDELRRTLELLRIYSKDLKFTKSSILTSANAPQFPNSEWSNVIIGSMVDLDHVISGSFAISCDNREVEVVGGIQFKFGTVKPSKQVRTSGDWFIAWRLYTQAVAFAFPHRRSELDTYGEQILSLFAATLPHNHSHIISLDKAIRVRVGERRNLLLSDSPSFDDLRLYWLNPIGAGALEVGTKDKALKATSRSEEACERWNRGACRSKASECKYRHVCQGCRGQHKIDECSKPRK